MSTLAHVLEAHGIATVAIASVREQAAAARPPRALAVDFPLGRPLGRPGDPDFQHRVLARALELLDRPSGPVLEDFDETIEAESAPLACSLPPGHDPDLSPAVSELQALRPAYERSVAARDGRTNVGRAVEPEGLAAVLTAFELIADGVAVEESGLPATLADAAMDLRTYFEEAALALSDHVPAARQADTWFARRTRTGAVLLAAQRRLREAGAAREVWLQLLPLDQGVLAAEQ